MCCVTLTKKKNEKRFTQCTPIFLLPKLDDVEYSIPALQTLPTLESILSTLDDDSDGYSEGGLTASQTPTPSLDDYQTPKMGTILRHIVLQGVTAQISSASVTYQIVSIKRKFAI